MARILVIEDDTASLDLMQYLLSAFGHTVIIARDGAAGVEQARNTLPDLILCDIQMPKLDGYGTILQLKSDPKLRPIPCVAITAFAMVGDRDRILAAGFDGYLTKPIMPDTFVSQTEAFLPSASMTTSASNTIDVAPVVEEPSPVATPSQPPVSHQATLLIIDNSPANREFLQALFEYSGYRVITTASIQNAFEELNQQAPDLILCDLHLQDESGLDFLRQVKSAPQWRELPFIITSSTSWRRKDQLEALALGASKFVLRPVEPHILLGAVKTALDPSSDTSQTQNEQGDL